MKTKLLFLAAFSTLFFVNCKQSDSKKEEKTEVIQPAKKI